MPRLLRILTLLLALAAPLAAAPTVPSTDHVTRPLAEGVILREETFSLGGRSIRARTVIALPGMAYRLIPAVAPKGLRKPATLRAIAESQSAIAAINGGFFGGGGFPVGTIVIDGQVASLDTRSRSAIGLLKDGAMQIAPLEAKAFVTFDDYFEPIWLWGYNQPLKQSAVVIYNRYLGAPSIGLSGTQRGIRLVDGQVLSAPRAGTLALGGTPPPPRQVEASTGPIVVSISDADLAALRRPKAGIPIGPQVLGFAQAGHGAVQRGAEGRRLYEGVVLPSAWRNATDLLTAGPTIVRDGKVVSQAGNPEGFASDILGRATRSVVGLGWSREWLLIQIPDAVSLAEAAEIAIALGCKSALNLDGGGSIGLYGKGENEFCYGCNGRQLGSALVIVKAEGPPRSGVPYFDGAIFDQWKAMQ